MSRWHIFVWSSLLSILAAPALAAPAPKAAEPDKPVNPSLLDTRWDFSDGALKSWQHKQNAQLAIADEAGNKTLRLTSQFTSFNFAWATRSIQPHSAAGVVHVTFRVRGDGSGHRLLVYLGAPRPERGGSLYYANEKQALTLDFKGCRPVSVDLDQFKTPGGGLRDRDLGQVNFLQFMIHARDQKTPLDVQFDDIQFTGYTPQEKAQIVERAQQRSQWIAAGKTSLEKVRASLKKLSEELDAQAAKGRFVDAARVYWAALNWCADDVERLLEAEEYDLVAQTPAFLEDLQRRLADPQCVLGRVLDKAPEEKDSLQVEKNPYFKAVVDVARHSTKKQRFWAKGRKGYQSVPNAWTAAGFGGNAYAMVWSMTRPKSPLRHHPMLAANTLNLLDATAHLHTDGDFNIDRTAIYGRDPNINRFCLAPALDAYCELLQAYPDLLPPRKRADLEAGLKQLADFQVTDYGLARIAQKPYIKQPSYPNMDVHHILIMEFAHRLWKEPKYRQECDAFVKILDSAVHPMGAWTYINTQNECFVYHHLNVLYSARFWKLTGNPITLAMLKRTIPFYPYNVEPAGMPEYYTDACWKHYWGGGAAPAPDVIAGLFDDPQNKRVAETCAKVWGYEHGYHAAIAAEFWKPIVSQAQPDHYVIRDTNIEGPRGRFGAWSFAGNGRNYGVGFQGKDTFVGCMLTDAAARPLPMDSALQIVATEVRINHTDNHWRGGRCHSALEKLTTAVGPDFGSLAVRYTLAKPLWGAKDDVLYPWQGVQTWYLSKTRLLGLVALEATADETQAAVHGRIRLGMKRTIESLDATTWRYGKLRIKIHEHNYARIVSKPSETFYLDKPEAYRSTEITLLDPLSVAAGEKGKVLFKKGTRYWFLVEVSPEGSAPAVDVKRIDADGLVGFRFREPGRSVILLHNPSEKQATVNLPSLGIVARAGLVIHRDYASGGQEPSGTSEPLSVLKPYSHAVLVESDKAK